MGKRSCHRGQTAAAWWPFSPPAGGAVIGCTEREMTALPPDDHLDQEGGDRATTWASFLI